MKPDPLCMKGHLMKRDRRYTKRELWRCPEDGYVIETEPGFYRDPEALPEELTCEASDCEETFVPELRHSWQQYHSTACRMRAYRRRLKERQAEVEAEQPEIDEVERRLEEARP